MYSDMISEGEPLWDYLVGLEDELGHNIWLLNGHGSECYCPTPFDGITIATWALFDGRGNEWDPSPGPIPGACFIDGEEHLRPIFDVRAATPGSPEIEYCVEGTMLAQIRPMAVAERFNITSFQNLGEVRWDAVIGDAVRRCCDPAFIAEYETTRTDAMIEAFSQFGAMRLEQGVNEARVRVENLENDLRMHERNAGRTLDRLREQQLVVDTQLALVRQRDTADPAAMYREIADHPRVREVRYATDTLFIRTDDIIMRRDDTDEERYLGPFLISFNLEFSGTVTMHNEGGTRRGGRDHPHVPGGEPCFGQLSNAMMRAIGQRDFLVALELSIQYLETLNVADEWGRYGAYWFDMPDAREANREEVTA